MFLHSCGSELLQYKLSAVHQYPGRSAEHAQLWRKVRISFGMPFHHTHDWMSMSHSSPLMTENFSRYFQQTSENWWNKSSIFVYVVPFFASPQTSEIPILTEKMKNSKFHSRNTAKKLYNTLVENCAVFFTYLFSTLLQFWEKLT